MASKPVYKGIIASALEDDHIYSDSFGKEDDLLFSRYEEGGNKIVRVKDEHKGGVD